LAVSAAASLGALPPLAAQRAAARPKADISIPFQKYTLGNGLTVVLAPDHAVPTVAVEVMYHVGSKNEQVGRTGFAHLFEHVMFTGSGHVPYGLHDKLTGGVGGDNNGSTDNDVTQYYETVPSNYLQDEIWLESDRMGWLLDALDTAKYNAQREIVKNERRQRVDNQPYGRAGEILEAATYPAGHPYSWPVVGSMTDLSNASIEDVKAFFRLYYAPNNATLAITGDFDPATAKAWVAKYFNGVPRGQAIVRPKAPTVTLPAEKRLMYEDRVQVPRLYIQWPTVGMGNADQYALSTLASILTGSRTARLTKALVYDAQSAANVSSFQSSNELVGEFGMAATPRPGHTLAELETTTDSIIADIQEHGPTSAEMQRAKAGDKLGFLSELQSNLGKAVDLAVGQTFFNDPSYEFTTGFAARQAVTAADVQRVARKYLGSGRVVLSVGPVGKTTLASHPESSVNVTSSAGSSTNPMEHR
jgi:zinc protease